MVKYYGENWIDQFGRKLKSNKYEFVVALIKNKDVILSPYDNTESIGNLIDNLSSENKERITQRVIGIRNKLQANQEITPLERTEYTRWRTLAFEYHQGENFGQDFWEIEGNFPVFNQPNIASN